MRILLLTQVVPYPPDSGPKIKTYNVLRYLALRHQVHLVSFCRSATEAANAGPLSEPCETVTLVPLHRSRAADAMFLARSLLSGIPFLIERDGSAAMRTAIEELLAEYRFDAVHADQLSMGQYALNLPVSVRVLDEHNAVWTIVRRAARHEGIGPRRIAAENEWRRLRSYEGELCRQFDVVTVVSNKDYLDLIEAAHSVFPAKVIPIAVDCQEMPMVPRPAASRRVLSLATMFYPPNAEGVHWFATQVLPRVRRELPDVEFSIVGSRPPRKIADLATPGSGIVVTGYLPDLNPVLRESALMIVPLRSGSGMRVKILEAFARGIPVVSTPIGVEGIDARDREHLLVADGPDDFSRAVVELLRHPEDAQLIARSARRLAEDLYDWRSALAPLDQIYRPETTTDAESTRGTQTEPAPLASSRS